MWNLVSKVQEQWKENKIKPNDKHDHFIFDTVNCYDSSCEGASTFDATHFLKDSRTIIWNNNMKEGDIPSHCLKPKKTTIIQDEYTINKGIFSVYWKNSIGSVIIILTRKPALTGKVVSSLVIYVMNCDVLQIPCKV